MENLNLRLRLKLKQKTNKHFFTLIEIMVCLTLLTIVGSFVGIKLHTLMGEIRSKRVIKEISSHINLCQKVALLQKSDMVITLRKDKDGIIFEMGSEGGHGFYNNTKSIKKRFKDLDFEFPEDKQEIEFNFCSTGTVTPTGELTFIDPKTKKKIDTIKISNRYCSDLEKAPLHPFDSEEFKEKDKKSLKT